MRDNIDQVWRTSSASLYRFIRARVQDAATADDLLQEVFLRALTRIETLRDETKLTSWLYQIARHAIVDHYRRQKPTAELDETIRAFDEPDENLERELAACLPGIVARLPASYRDALVLSEIKGLPQKQVAQKLGLSLSGTKSRVQRARRKIKRLLLACCDFEFDRLGKIIDYRPKCDPQTCAGACC